MRQVEPQSSVVEISVCMATYNGVQFVRAQIESILAQLGSGDELIICDDRSTDGTWELVSTVRDPRIRAYQNDSRLGHVQNFARALALARGRYIALSDQDDVWVEGRLRRMLEAMMQLPPASLVIGDFIEVDEDGEIRDTRLNRLEIGEAAANRLWQIVLIFIGRIKYFGCTFLIDRALVSHLIPMPRAIEAHDVWIAMKACVHGRIGHLRENTLWHRVHGQNLTPQHRRRTWPIIRSRVIYAYYLGKDWWRG